MRIALLFTALVVIGSSIGCEKRITGARAMPARPLDLSVDQTIAATFSAAATTGVTWDAPCS